MSDTQAASQPQPFSRLGILFQWMGWISLFIGAANLFDFKGSGRAEFSGWMVPAYIWAGALSLFTASVVLGYLARITAAVEASAGLRK